MLNIWINTVMALAVLLFFAASIWRAQAQCSAAQLVTRAEWGARPPNLVTPLEVPVNMTFVHHSAGSHCTTLEDCSAVVRAIQDYHMDSNGWDDIGYSFLVGEDGRVYEGRGWTNRPAHSPTYNDFSHGTCILGDYMTVAPLQVAQDTTQAWIQCGVDLGYILPNYELFGHRDGRCTLCPGDVLYSIIQTWPQYSFRDIPVYCSTA